MIRKLQIIPIEFLVKKHNNKAIETNENFLK